MRIFLDTANIAEIEQGARLGVVSGATTNPGLVAEEGPASQPRPHPGDLLPQLVGWLGDAGHDGMAFQALTQMIKHPPTGLGLARLLVDWERVLGAQV